MHHHLSWERPHLAYYFDIDVPREGILHAVVTGSFVELSTQWDIELGTFWWDYIGYDGRLGRHVPAGRNRLKLSSRVDASTNVPFTIRVWLTDLQSDPEPTPEPEPETPRRGPRVATLLNLSPWQAWVHLYCQKARPASDADPVAPCTVRFECNGMSGEPVAWNVDVPPKTIFSYWPNKTVDGMEADLQAALMETGKAEEEARRRTTCEVFSPDPLAVRGYTLFGGQPTLVSVAVYE